LRLCSAEYVVAAVTDVGVVNAPSYIIRAGL
jgi:hypothetical protein